MGAEAWLCSSDGTPERYVFSTVSRNERIKDVETGMLRRRKETGKQAMYTRE